MESSDKGYIYAVLSQAAAAQRVIPIDHTKPLEGERYKTHPIAFEFLRNKIFFANLDIISKDLKIPASYIATFFAKKLHMSTGVDNARGNRWYLFPASALPGQGLACLSDTAIAFIKKAILCRHCHLPELRYLKVIQEEREKEHAAPASSTKSSQNRKKKNGNKNPNASKVKVDVSCRACSFHCEIADLNLDAALEKHIRSEPPTATTTSNATVPKKKKKSDEEEDDDDYDNPTRDDTSSDFFAPAVSLGNGWTMPSAFNGMPSLSDF